MGQDASATLCWGIYLGEEGCEYTRRLDAKTRGVPYLTEEEEEEQLRKAVDDDEPDEPEDSGADYYDPEGLPVGLEIITTCSYDQAGYILAVTVTKNEASWEEPHLLEAKELVLWSPKDDQALLDEGMRALGLSPKPGAWLLSAFYG